MKDAIYLRLLILDDTDSWRERLVGWFGKIRSVDGHRLKLELVESSYEKDMRRKLRGSFFHAASVDQNMPEGVGGKIAPELGIGLVKYLAKAAHPPLVAVYTAYGQPGLANEVGHARAPYKVKSAETSTEGESLTPRDYCHWFVHDFFLPEFVRRVLQMAAQSGLEDIRKRARAALEHEKTAMETKRRGEITLYMKDMDRFHELLTKYLAALTAAIWAGPGRYPPSKGTAGTYIHWLKKTWLGLERGRDERFRAWKEFMGIPKNMTMAEYYLDEGLGRLNAERNRAEHDGHEYDHALWKTLRPALFRMMELTAWLVTRPLLAAPSRGRHGLLSCTDYRGIQPRDIDLYYPVEDDLPASSENAMFTRLTNRDDEPLTEITNGLALMRDKKTGNAKVRRRLC